jgi:hypothetical protein
MMQVKISIVEDTAAPVETLTKVSVAEMSDKGVQGAETLLEVGPGADVPSELTFGLPLDGSLVVKEAKPPLVYDVEQKAAVPGEWEDALTPEAKAKKEKDKAAKGGAHEEGKGAPKSATVDTHKTSTVTTGAHPQSAGTPLPVGSTPPKK